MGQTMTAPSTPASTRRILTASLVGTSVEYFDFYIYATAAALVFGPLFFPNEDPGVELLLAYASLGTAFLARPLGAWVFGHYGDRIGRKSTLVASLLLMGGATVAIAFLPTYASIGWWAPLILNMLRFCQGFGLGGEWGGAALLAVENAPPGWQSRFGMMPQFGAPIGFIAANGMFLVLGLVLTPDQFMSWGWRLPFLFSIILVGLGLWVRLKIAETPDFAKTLEDGPPPLIPIGELMRLHWRVTLGGTLATVSCFAVYYIATAFTLGYATTSLGIDRQTFLSLQLAAILFMALGILISGYAADRFGAYPVLIAGGIFAIAAALLLAPTLGSGSLPVIFAGLAVLLLAMGFIFGPIGAWLPSLFPTRVRYTGVSIAFNMAGIIGGGLTPVLAQALSQRGGLAMVGVYLTAACVVSLVALLALRPRVATPSAILRPRANSDAPS